jgi:hypothetical protein
MQRFLTVVLLGLATSAFADISWTRDKVVGLHMELVDSKRIESYWCAKGGSVAVDIGTKKKITPQLIKEWVSTPEWYWKIHNGRLQLSDSSHIREELILLDMGRGVITARRKSGEISRFRYCFDCPKT